MKKELSYFFALFLYFNVPYHQDTHFCPCEKESMKDVFLCQKEKAFLCIIKVV